MARKRLRVTTGHGTDCAIAMPREHDPVRRRRAAARRAARDRRAVHRAALAALAPQSAADALELGYHAGNLHWRVRFDHDVAVRRPRGAGRAISDRIAPLLKSGRVVADVELAA